MRRWLIKTPGPAKDTAVTSNVDHNHAAPRRSSRRALGASHRALAEAPEPDPGLDSAPSARHIRARANGWRRWCAQ